MKKLLNTLYVLTPESYLFCRNENICVKIEDTEKLCIPALNIDAIVCFGKMTVSTPLLEFCGSYGISLTFIRENGHFMGRLQGPASGNVLLRKRQYATIQDEDFAQQIVQSILLAKLRNSKLVLMRAARSERARAFKKELELGVERLNAAAENLLQCSSIDSMRGIEGTAANAYFAQFDRILTGNPGGFCFDTRSRRPPRNEVNATLSFTYMLLTSQMQSAMETVGIDPAAGYLHTLRPGRASFALDLIEELRAPLCDRFVLSLFNKGQLSSSDFDRDEEMVSLNDRGRRTLLSAWEKRKQEQIMHPFLKEKIPIGLIPYAQTMLFARVLRGDLDQYPPFVWR